MTTYTVCPCCGSSNIQIIQITWAGETQPTWVCDNCHNMWDTTEMESEEVSDGMER